MIKLLFTHPFRLLRMVLNGYLYPFIISRKKGLYISGQIRIKGFPRIDITDGASIKIEDNVTLDSSNDGYHINMHSPVKLLADRPGAEIVIKENTRIHGTCIHSCKKISIGRNCLIAANCQIFDESGHDLSFPNVENRINTRGDTKPILIGDNVWLGANCIILPGVSIGNGSVIAAGSVVIKDIPGFVLAGGNPAKVIREYASS